MHEQREFWLEGTRLKGHHLPFRQPSIPSAYHTDLSVIRDSLTCDIPTISLYLSVRHLPRIAETPMPLLFPVCDPLKWARRLRIACWQPADCSHSCEVTYTPSGLLCAFVIEGLRTRLKSSVWGTHKYFRLLRLDHVTCAGKEVNAFPRTPAPARHSRYGFALLQQSTTSEVKRLWRSF